MPRSSVVLAHPNSQPYGSDGRMFFIAKSTSSATQSLITGFPTPSIMKTSRQQTSQGGKDKSTYSQEDSLANLSVQQDGDLERTMTATSGQRCYESSGRYSPLSSLVRTLLVSSRWYSPAKRLRWEAQPLSSRRTTTFTKKKQEFVVETVCSDLECEGYSVQPFVIPACAVGAPHQRDRVWFIARRNVPTSPTDTMYEGILRRPSVNESEGKAQRLQERNEIQQPTEPSSLLRHAPDTFNTGAEGMRERQAENSLSRAASHTISGGDTTQQAYQGSEEERRKDDGQQSQRRATPQWADGLLKLSRHTADTLRTGFQEERGELQTEGITRNVPQMGLAADTRGERRDEGHDDNGQPKGAPQEERCTEQPGGADCPQNWWRDFPTVSPVCRGNDGLPFDISRLTIPFSRWRQESIKALGNSMVPQVVFELFKAIAMEIFEE